MDAIETQRGAYRLRPATLADRDAIVALRRLMFEEMERGDEAELAQMEANTRAYLERAMLAGEFFAWVVDDAAGLAAACGAAIIHQRLPTVHNASGREAYVLNVCTYPQHRRRGLARWIMQAILAWARQEEISQVVLRSSAQGRPLYESLGFEATSEMRLRLETNRP